MVLKPVAAIFVAVITLGALGYAQAPIKYEPTIESLDKHPLPQWYAGAKLGIFIHWGLYSVPGWAPLSHPDHDFPRADYIKYNPYAEWYLNVMRIPGSPRGLSSRTLWRELRLLRLRAHLQSRIARSGIPTKWAAIFRDAGARYVVLTSKHHEGFTLWPSTTPNPSPSLKAKPVHAERDIVGDLTTAVRKQGLKMGLYYSGGYDWTFNTGPIETDKDYQTVKPESEAYGKYAFARSMS